MISHPARCARDEDVGWLGLRALAEQHETDGSDDEANHAYDDADVIGARKEKCAEVANDSKDNYQHTNHEQNGTQRLHDDPP